MGDVWGLLVLVRDVKGTEMRRERGPGIAFILPAC